MKTGRSEVKLKYPLVRFAQIYLHNNRGCRNELSLSSDSPSCIEMLARSFYRTRLQASVFSREPNCDISHYVKRKKTKTTMRFYFPIRISSGLRVCEVLSSIFEASVFNCPDGRSRETRSTMSITLVPTQFLFFSSF